MNTPTLNYPSSPGSKGEHETGRQAAAAVRSSAEQTRAHALAAYRGAAMTHDECAALLRPEGMGDVAFETFKRGVRSRSSELKAQGRIEPTERRRCNVSGHSAVVWRAVRPLVQAEMFT